jgi:hypothetical protein
MSARRISSASVCVVGSGERRLKISDLLPIHLGQVRVQPRRRRRRGTKLGRERRLALLEFIEPRLQARGAKTIGDRLDDAGELARDVVVIAALLHERELDLVPLPVHLGMELARELGDVLGLH